MNAKEIYDILRAGGMTRAGALGMLGNMMAESSLIPNIVQRGMTNLSDAEYTRQADEGLLDFTKPIGYGLCQWTYHTRKAALMAYAKEMGISVGDGVMQCYFCLHELREDYPDLFMILCTSNDINGCADRICNTYECPAVNNYSARQNAAHRFEQEIPDGKSSYTPPIKDPIKATFPPDATVLAFQLWMNYNGYACETNGYKSKEFFRKLREFTDDMEKC